MYYVQIASAPSAAAAAPAAAPLVAAMPSKAELDAFLALAAAVGVSAIPITAAAALAAFNHSARSVHAAALSDMTNGPAAAPKARRKPKKT